MKSTPEHIAALIADPERIAAIPMGILPELIGACAALQARLFARLHEARTLAPAPAPQHASGTDRLLDVNKAAAVLGVSPRWLYRRSRELPFVRRIGGNLRFSERGLAKWQESRR